MKTKKLHFVQPLQEVIDNHLDYALVMTEYNISQAALELKVHRRTLQRMLSARRRAKKASRKRQTRKK